MSSQGFWFPNQNISCLANSTFPFPRASRMSRLASTYPFSSGNSEQVDQAALPVLHWRLTPDASLSLSEVPFVLTEQIACSRRPCLSSAPPSDQRLSGVVIKTWCL